MTYINTKRLWLEKWRLIGNLPLLWKQGALDLSLPVHWRRWGSFQFFCTVCLNLWMFVVCQICLTFYCYMRLTVLSFLSFENGDKSHTNLFKRHYVFINDNKTLTHFLYCTVLIDSIPLILLIVAILKAESMFDRSLKQYFVNSFTLWQIVLPHYGLAVMLWLCNSM